MLAPRGKKKELKDQEFGAKTNSKSMHMKSLQRAQGKKEGGYNKKLCMDLKDVLQENKLFIPFSMYLLKCPGTHPGAGLPLLGLAPEVTGWAAGYEP